MVTMNSLTQPSGQSLYKFAFIASHVSLHRDMGSALEPLASLTERATEPTSGTARQQNSLQGRSLLLEPLALREALSVRAQEPRGGAGKHPPPPPPGVPALSLGVGLQPSEPATHHVPAAKGRITSRSHSPPTAYAGGALGARVLPRPRRDCVLASSRAPPRSAPKAGGRGRHPESSPKVVPAG